MKFQKGHPGYKPKGAKSRATLEKEARRMMFDERISQKWESTIDKLKPEYVADQFMGKAPDKADVTVKFKPFDELFEDDSISKNKESPKEN